jgi:hypothetical protein
MARLGAICRRLEALERVLGESSDDDFGPAYVIVITKYWRPGGTGAGDAADEQDADDAQGGPLREKRLIDAAVAEVRQEARERREQLGPIVVTVTDRGEVEFGGVPWRPAGKELAWRQGLYPRRS